MGKMKKAVNVMKTMITENPKYMQSNEEKEKSSRLEYDIFIRFKTVIDEELYHLLFQIGSWSQYGTKVLRGGSYVPKEEVEKFIKEKSHLSSDEYEVSDILLGGNRVRL